MRKIGFIIATMFPLLLLASLVMAPHQTSEETTASASLTISQFIDITITDRGAAGVNFGSLDPATNNNPEAAQNSTHGAVNFKVESTTNKNPASVKLNATVFAVGGDFFDGNVTADDDATIEQASETGSAQIQLTTVFPTLKTLAPGASTEIWYWVDVPSSQATGTYTSTFGFRGD